MSVVLCSCGCNSSVEEHKRAKCCICSKDFKHSCVDLTVTEIRTLKSKKGLSWSCRDCASLGSTINELKAAIQSLREDLQLRQPQPISEPVFEELLHELSERSYRGQNIILFNLTELASSDTNARYDHDKASTSAILENLSPHINSANLEVRRIGRFNRDGDRPRPLRVRLNSVKDVHTVIKNTRKLSTTTFKHISVSFDRTPRQIEYYKRIKRELDNRIASGEKDLKIRYRNGVPTIGDLN